MKHVLITVSANGAPPLSYQWRLNGTNLAGATNATLPLLVQTAEQGESASLRISAIGALGLLGGKPEMALLEKIIAGDNPRLAPVATAALRRLRERSGQL